MRVTPVGNWESAVAGGNSRRIGRSGDDLYPTAKLLSKIRIAIGVEVLTLHFRGRP